MEKLQYGTFDSTSSDITFDSNKGYTEPSGESEVRKQLSYPLKEIKDYINKTTPVKTSNDDVIQLGLSSNKTLQYRDTENGRWVDTASSGHIIFADRDGEKIQLPQRTELEFQNVTVSDTGSRTVIRGLQGPQGEQGEQGIQGVQGIQGPQGYSFQLSGTFATYEDLIENVPNPSIGDSYAVGTNPYHTYVYGKTASGNAWSDLGELTIGPSGPQGQQGVQGIQGPQGLQGPSGEGVPTGGLAGQFLKKQSDADFDAIWDMIPAYMEKILGATEDDILITNASGQAVDSGTKLDDLKPLEIKLTNFSSLPRTARNENITEKHTVVYSVLSNPSAQVSEWTVTTSNGSLMVDGSIADTTDLTLYLALKP